MINLLKHQFDQAISNYGIDLTYFRKYNTFFKDDDENHANMIYGEDSTAQFYASGVIRAFVSVDNMAWNFNQIGLEATEQINMYVTIENFEQSFANRIGKIETRHIEVPVTGDTIHNEITGMINEPEFQAFVYSQFDDNMSIKHAQIKMLPKEVDNTFYYARFNNTSIYEISGDLGGRLKYDSQYPYGVYGLLAGDLSFHGKDNIEGSETWQLAPQVGDYFKLDTPTGISEEWEINQVFDRNLTKNGLNPLLGKYVYQMTAVRRVESHEENTDELNYREPGEDIEEILGNVASPRRQYADQYTEKKGKNVQNEKTNKLGKNAYNYTDRSDETYGGVQNQPPSK
jgi:hypothetical protein